MLKKGQLDLTTAIQLAKDTVMANLNCHNIGRIVEFYPDTQTADIEVMQVKTQYDGFYNLPLLTGVPVVIYGTNNAYITLPDLTGTICLLFFMDRNITSFLQTGEIYTPDTGRMHDFTDCIALTTFKNDTNPISNYDNEAVTILNTQDNSTSYIKTYADNAVINSTTTIATEDQTTTSATTTTIAPINGVINSSSTIQTSSGLTVATSNFNVNPNSVLIENSGGGQIEVNAKINIENTAQNLATLMQSFLNACANITVNTNTGVLTPTSKQAFTDLAPQFEELLQ